MQRHKFPASQCRIRPSLGEGSLSNSPFAATKNPGVQIPHCSAASSRKACCNGWRPSVVAIPSTVSTVFPSTSGPSTKHESTILPSTLTVQAPQFPSRQPSFVPVSPISSRSVSRRLMYGGTSNSCSWPLIVVVT